MTEQFPMRFRISANNNFEPFDAFVANMPHGDMRQTTYWGEISRFNNWKPTYCVVDGVGGIHAVAMILERWVPFLSGTVLYCCRGPVLDWADTQVRESMFLGLRDLAHSKNAVVLRMDPDIPTDAVDIPTLCALHKLQQIPDATTIWNRSPYTTRVLLDTDDSTLYRRLNRNNRRNIAYAIRMGVTTSHDTNPDDDTLFAHLLSDLEKHHKSRVHKLDEHRHVFRSLMNSRRATFIKASYNGRVIAGLLILILGNKAWAAYIGNDFNYRDLTPNKVVMWEGMRFCRNHKCRFLDLGATQGKPDFDPLTDGFDRLKDGFGATAYRYPGYLDIPGRRYGTFRNLERHVLPTAYRVFANMRRTFFDIRSRFTTHLTAPPSQVAGHSKRD